MKGDWRKAHKIEILETAYLTHDVKRIRTSKPEGYQFVPGEATDMVIPLAGWQDQRHAFTFTGLNEWPFLEFTIKIYPSHHNFTARLDSMQAGDYLLIHDSFGAIQYHGQGTFIAGGSGITPFIAILRQLSKEHKTGINHLIFSNRTHADIILKDEFEEMLGNHFVNTLTREQDTSMHFGRIDRNFLKKHIDDFSQYFYICGKRVMMETIRQDLTQLASSL